MSAPNLVFLLADQFRHDCVGYRGLRAIRTPNLDALSRQSCVYTQAYTPMPVCAPVRQSLLSGVHPDAIGAFWNYDFFATKTIQPEGTWPTELRERGYRGAYLGKWHCSPHFGPADFGYTDITTWAEHKQLMGRKYPGLQYTGGWGGCNSPVEVQDSETHWLAARAADRIREYAKSNAPFHMWVDWGIPHLPCRPSEPFSGMYDPGDIPPWDGFEDAFVRKPYCQRQQAINWGLDGCPWSDIAPMVARYQAMISQLDDAIGIILRALDECGLADNTIVVFTSDHGDMCGSHRMLDKHYVLFDDVTRIPLLVRAPGVAPRTSDAFVSGCLDTEATIRRLLGLPSRAGGHGRALPFSEEEEAGARQTITSSANGQQFGLYCSRMLRDRRWKYIWNMTDIDELYDMETDPGETVNRIDDATLADRLAEMRKALHAELVAHGDPFIGGGWLDSQLLEGRQHL